MESNLYVKQKKIKDEFEELDTTSKFEVMNDMLDLLFSSVRKDRKKPIVNYNSEEDENDSDEDSHDENEKKRIIDQNERLYANYFENWRKKIKKGLSNKFKLEKPSICLKTFIGHREAVFSLLYLSDQKQIASGSYDSKIKIWDIESGNLIRTLDEHQDAVTCLIEFFDGNKKFLASGSFDNSILLWDFNTWGIAKSALGHTDSVKCFVNIKNSKQHHFLASGGADKKIIWWDSRGRNIRTLAGHTGEINSLAYFSNIKNCIVSASADRSIKIWDIDSGSILKTYSDHKAAVNCIISVIIGGITYLASGSNDYTIKIWNPSLGCINTIEKHDGPVTSLSMIDGKENNFLISGGHDGNLNVFDLEEKKCVQKITTNHLMGVLCFVWAYSGDQRCIVSGGADHNIKSWKLEKF